MKEKILYIVLTVSIGANIGFLGIYLFFVLNKPPKLSPPFEDKKFNKNYKNFENFRNCVDSIKKYNEKNFEKLEITKEKIFELVKNDNPDTFLLDSLLKEQAKTRYYIDRNLVFTILNNRDKFTPQEKEFLQNLFRRGNQPQKMLPRKK